MYVDRHEISVHRITIQVITNTYVQLLKRVENKNKNITIDTKKTINWKLSYPSYQQTRMITITVNSTTLEFAFVGSILKLFCT